MFFQMDDSGDSGNGIKSFSEACGDLGIAPVPAFTAQSEAGFCYEFHSGMHGDAVVYVNKSKKGDRINKNVPAIKLGPPVANVRGEEIALGDWQDRVRYQRAQFIINMEDQLESFGDVGLVQQFNGQQIQLLQDGQELGRLVLEQMVDETIIRQEAAKRNITVSSAEIDAAIGEQFSYYGGEAPTPLPTRPPTRTKPHKIGPTVFEN